MPTYEYECRDCGRLFDYFQSMSEARKEKCEKCGGTLTRLLSGGTGLIFKGSGFYITDYKPSAKGESKSGEGSSGGSDKSEGSGDSAKSAGTGTASGGDSGSAKSDSASKSTEGGAKATPKTDKGSS